MSDEPQQSLVPRSDGTPAVRAESIAADPFEREYMPGDGMVLYRDKMAARIRATPSWLGVGALLLVVAISMSPWLLLFEGLLLVVMWLVFGVLRVTVSERTVTVKLGLLGPTIPVAAVESAIAFDYRWGAFGGWGIRRGAGGTMYNVIGDGGRAVKIVWHTEAGARTVTYVGTRTADELARAINRARAALPAGDEAPRAVEGESPSGALEPVDDSG